MKRIIGLTFVFLIIVVFGCGKKEEVKEEVLDVSSALHPGINKSITSLSSSQFEVDGVLITIVGLDYAKNAKISRKNGWETSDNRGITESFFTGIGLGISGASSKEKDKDGELVVYMEMQLADDQRPKVADIPIKITDDKDAESSISFASFGYGPMSPGQKYLEVAEFKVYSDVEYFLIKIGKDHLFKVEAPKFRWE